MIINKSKVLGVAGLISVVLLIAVAVVFSAKEMSAWTKKCESLGGHVDSDTAYHTGPVYDYTLKRTVIKTTTTTTYDCINEDGIEIHI